MAVQTNKTGTAHDRMPQDMPAPPARYRRPSAFTFAVLLAAAAFLIHGWSQGAAVSLADLVTGAGRFGEFLTDAFPPDLKRAGPILHSLLVTFEMALLGTLIGVALSVPLAITAARNTTPHRLFYIVSRGFISVCRTIPDLVWALIFVIAVGLGPQAGVLAIAVDVMGFCGRFFADAIEEMDDGVLEGMRSSGAPERAVILGTVLPTCLPSFVGTSMFALEQATRSSVVLGLVGAGGIGIELSVSMALLRYDEALTIILAIFIVVLGVERLSAALRRRILGGKA
ncbi:phosphonate ABC transporter, permease protein PhnE [Arthrobacter sulfonylureivorans]|uniref:Phosphonate ABC transporter, permease protein PhnE n=1 Tax=Arthrobacter sulfonylureivorans TaxID=2486855 RepID=A0ABY3WGZ5_9MICC|nr:phosphonate ABC transporter, permease protein PhnE [Arthrobacter sulfonylureivorans]UNK47828.1 phosphonate ABC transporter, permease protein PhnE [Arthrobacter sulfonylureivorans]